MAQKEPEYSLQKERLYVSLYDVVRTKKNEEIDYDMQATYKKYQETKNNYWCCLMSKTEVGFYIPVALLTAFVIFLTC